MEQLHMEIENLAYFTNKANIRLFTDDLKLQVRINQGKQSEISA